MNTIEAAMKNIEADTATVKRNRYGAAEMCTDAHGRHLFFVTGDVYNGDGTTSPGGIYVWALSARAARTDGHALYIEKHGRELHINRAYMPIY